MCYISIVSNVLAALCREVVSVMKTPSLIRTLCMILYSYTVYLLYVREMRRP